MWYGRLPARGKQGSAASCRKPAGAELQNLAASFREPVFLSKILIHFLLPPLGGKTCEVSRSEMVTTVLRRQVSSSGAFLHSKVKEYLLKDRSVCCTADTGHCTQGQCRPQVICLPTGQENFVQMIIYKHMESSVAQAEYINMHPLLLPCFLPFFILRPFLSFPTAALFFP